MQAAKPLDNSHIFPPKKQNNKLNVANSCALEQKNSDLMCQVSSTPQWRGDDSCHPWTNAGLKVYFWLWEHLSDQV